MKVYANFSHTVHSTERDDGTTYEVYYEDEILVEDGFTTEDAAIAYADLHETRG